VVLATGGSEWCKSAYQHLRDGYTRYGYTIHSTHRHTYSIRILHTHIVCAHISDMRSYTCVEHMSFRTPPRDWQCPFYTFLCVECILHIEIHAFDMPCTHRGFWGSALQCVCGALQCVSLTSVVSTCILHIEISGWLRRVVHECPAPPPRCAYCTCILDVHVF